MKISSPLYLAVFALFSSIGAASAYAEQTPRLNRDTINVRVVKVTDADTYKVQYRTYRIFPIRLRMPIPTDTVDTFDRNVRRAKKQAARLGISLDSVRVLAVQATAFTDSVLKANKYQVKIIHYPDQNVPAKDVSFNRLLRGVVVDGKHLGTLLRERGFTVESRLNTGK